MKVLIDSDIVCYRAGFACENEDLAIALWQADQIIERIIAETGATSWQLFLTGSNNFRYKVNPEYKANRKDVRRPKWLPQLREHLVVKWNACVSDGIEADDAMGIEQDKETNTTCIATIDKDLLMIPGLHFNFVKGVHKEVTKLEGKQFLYFQLLMGDGADNIFGFDGKARPKVPKFLVPIVEELYTITEEKDMYDFICDKYSDAACWSDDWRSVVHMNAHCLYIWHKENDKWEVPC
jgi:hypothetical protein